MLTTLAKRSVLPVPEVFLAEHDLLVHVGLFGGSYLARVEQTLQRFGV